MKKPRLFIGSSIEGLNIAYAIQENLCHSAEITVWDQGVFDLSDTTIESLVLTLENTDFGVFVFTPDDIVILRGKKNLSVRDNVLFELGLFIGRIGRKRSFIVIPDNSTINLPTDLLGITPGKYETNRSDGNLKAGTGSFSNKIREAINKLGFVEEPDFQLETVSQIKEEQKSIYEDWIEEIYINKNYEEGIKLLNKKIKTAKLEDEKVNFEGNICFCQLHLDYKKGIENYEKLILKFSQNNMSYKAYAKSLMDNNNFDAAFEIIERGLTKCERKIGLTLMKAECFWATNKKSEAINVLKNTKNRDLEICSQLASYYSENKEHESAIMIAKEGYKIDPKDVDLLTRFARISFDIADYELSLFLYNELITIAPNNQAAWCMLGNSYYHNELYNSALNAYEKANELAEEKESWIFENLGNLYKNRGFFHKAESYLTKANAIFDKSEYGLARLSDTYKSIEEEKNKIIEIIASGKAKLSETKEIAST